MGKFQDLTGRRYGRLTVIERAEDSSWGRTRWLCQCDCGNMMIAVSNQLKSGQTKSCGCYQRDWIKAYNTTCEGDSGKRLWRIWHQMIERCEKPYSTNYRDYGGRGITVCDEWHDYSAFKAWATGNGYSDDLTINRMDNDGNYHPGNCRWVDANLQSTLYIHL